MDKSHISTLGDFLDDLFLFDSRNSTVENVMIYDLQIHMLNFSDCSEFCKLFTKQIEQLKKKSLEFGYAICERLGNGHWTHQHYIAYQLTLMM